jgi:hypothetical protein
MGQNVVDPDMVLNPQYRHYKFGGEIYGISPTTLAVGQQGARGYRPLNPEDAADSETIAVIRSMYMGGVSLPPNYRLQKTLQGINRKLTDEERRQTESDLIGVTPVAGDIQDFYVVWTGRNPRTGKEVGPWEYGVTVVAAALPVVSGHTVARVLGKGIDETIEAGARSYKNVPGYRLRGPEGARRWQRISKYEDLSRHERWLLELSDLADGIQKHHLVTEKMARALDELGLSGQFLRKQDSLQYPSTPGGHVGYEDWHRNYDQHMLGFIETTPGLTEEALLKEIHRYYQSGEAAARIPDVDLGF